MIVPVLIKEPRGFGPSRRFDSLWQRVSLGVPKPTLRVVGTKVCADKFHQPGDMGLHCPQFTKAFVGNFNPDSSRFFHST